MKKIVLISILALNLMAADQVSFLKVIDVKEVYKNVVVKKPMDRIETICENDDGTGGSIIGAIIGGVIGSQFGQGDGKLLSTGIGTLIGSSIGRDASKGSKCYDRRITEYIEEEKDVFSHYIVTVEGGQKFKTQKRYNVGDIAKVRMSLD